MSTSLEEVGIEIIKPFNVLEIQNTYSLKIISFRKIFYLTCSIFENQESLRVVPSLKAKTPAKITIKNDIPARSGEFIPRPEEKSTLERSNVL